MNILTRFFGTEENETVFDKLSFLFLFLTTFLLPFFVLPSSIFIFSFSKSIILVIGVILSLIFWLIARLKEGSFELPKSIIFVFAGIVPFVYLLASLFSGSIRTSLFGRGFELDTFGSILALFLLFVLIPFLFKSSKRILYLYLGMFVSAIIIAIYQILRLVFGVDFLTLGVLGSPTSNLVGKWNDLAVFFGLMSVLSLTTLELLKTSRVIKIFIYSMLIVSLMFLWIINFTTVWVLIGLFSLIFFLYTILFKSKREIKTTYENSTETKRKFSITSLIVFMVSLVFVISGGIFMDSITNTLGIYQVEARPSWGATFEISGEALKENPVFGIGPNRFTSQWLASKPEGINNTLFWDTNFNSGIGLIPSTLTTTGVLGFISWILFVGTLLFLGFKKILGNTEDPLTRFIAMSSFLASVYLWVFTILYTPNLVILSMAMMFSGIFVAYLYKEGAIKPIEVNFAVNPRVGFIAISIIVFLFVSLISWGTVFIRKFTASAQFQKGLIEFNVNGDLQASVDSMNRAVNIDGDDLYYRNLSQINIIELNTILADKNISEEELRNQFLSTLGKAVENAQKATDVDKTNYLNWLSLGKIYEAVIPLKIEGSYESAMGAYNEALKHNPESPAIILMKARLELVNENIEEAKKFITQALQKKNNYTEAVFLLSQIQASEGNVDEAIKSVEAAASLAPNDPTVFFQLGLLKYNNKDYKDSIPELERAVILSPTYANAKYFLGLAYEKVRRNKDAIIQFEDIKILNPNNEEVDAILTNLKAGKDPFTSFKQPTPDEGDKLPIEE